MQFPRNHALCHIARENRFRRLACRLVQIKGLNKKSNWLNAELVHFSHMGDDPSNLTATNAINYVGFHLYRPSSFFARRDPENLIFHCLEV